MPPVRAPGELVAVLDPDDDLLRPYRDLTDAVLRRHVEDAGRFFVVEGHLAVANLLASPYRVRSMLIAESRAARLGDLVTAVRAAGADVLVAPQAVLAETVGFNLHRGVVALASRAVPADPATIVAAATVGAAAPVLAVVEGVNDHENLGALFRNAAAFGVAAVLLDPTTADPLYRRSIRVSMGHVLRVPFARFTSWPDDLAQVRAAGVTLVALTPAASADDLATVAGLLSGPVGVLVGAEGPGLSPGALAAAAVRARIPMAPGVDSLNVATAAAIAFHRFAAESRQAR